jgi:hypothetical protein
LLEWLARSLKLLDLLLLLPNELLLLMVLLLDLLLELL